MVTSHFLGQGWIQGQVVKKMVHYSSARPFYDLYFSFTRNTPLQLFAIYFSIHISNFCQETTRGEKSQVLQAPDGLHVLHLLIQNQKLQTGGKLSGREHSGTCSLEASCDSALPPGKARRSFSLSWKIKRHNPALCVSAVFRPPEGQTRTRCFRGFWEMIQACDVENVTSGQGAGQSSPLSGILGNSPGAANSWRYFRFRG